METFLDQGKIFVQQRIFLERGNFLETEFSIKMIKEMFYKKFSFIKETFHKQRLFLDQGSFPQTKIYLQSRKLSNVFLWSRKYFKVEKVFSSKKKILKTKIKKVFENARFQIYSIIKIWWKNIFNPLMIVGNKRSFTYTSKLCRDV